MTSSLGPALSFLEGIAMNADWDFVMWFDAIEHNF
jgi:hypothetical protein